MKAEKLKKVAKQCLAYYEWDNKMWPCGEGSPVWYLLWSGIKVNKQTQLQNIKYNNTLLIINKWQDGEVK